MRATVKNVDASKKKCAPTISKKNEFLEDPGYMQAFGGFILVHMVKTQCLNMFLSIFKIFYTLAPPNAPTTSKNFPKIFPKRVPKSSQNLPVGIDANS